MTILKSPYETTGYRGFSIKPMQDAIVMALTHQDLTVDEYGIIEIASDSASVRDIKSFNHPVIVQYNAEEHVAVDVRYFVRPANRQDRTAGFVVKTPNEYDLAMYEGRFTQRWIQGDQRRLLSVHSVLMSGYVNWITDTVSRRMVLDIHEQTFLRIASAFFYASHFFDKDTMSPRDRDSISAMIARNIRVPAAKVIEVTDRFPVISDIQDFVDQVVQHSHSVRLSKLTAGALISLLSSSWFGMNAARTTSVAIEHIPTWFAMVLTACEHRVYRNTALAKSIERTLGRDKPDQLIQALRAVIAIDK